MSAINTENLPKNYKKYFTRYGLDNWRVEATLKSKPKIVVVIPAYNEKENIKPLLESFERNDIELLEKTLILFVVNNKADSPSEVIENNRETIELLRSEMNNESNLNIGIVDASSEGLVLPEKDGGVGLARKIGMDLALTLFDYNTGKNLIVALDGDCLVESNYLSELAEAFKKNDYSAAVVNYKHQKTDDTHAQRGISSYEIYLRYYSLGLLYAGSPYAYYSIGSTMVCDADYYVKAQGMTKRKVAEDFYFLEKLAKQGKIGFIGNTKVYPSSRFSERVPFGTGRRILQYVNGDNHLEETVLYNPRSFLMLKEWLKIYNEFSEESIVSLLEKGEKISLEIRSFLEESGFEKAWKKIYANVGSARQLERQKNEWFDALKTLRFIHHLRDRIYPKQEMIPAVLELLDMCGENFAGSRPQKDIEFEEILLAELERITDKLMSNRF